MTKNVFWNVHTHKHTIQFWPYSSPTVKTVPEVNRGTRPCSQVTVVVAFVVEARKVGVWWEVEEPHVLHKVVVDPQA